MKFSELPPHEKLGLILVGCLLAINVSLGSVYLWFMIARTLTPF